MKRYLLVGSVALLVAATGSWGASSSTVVGAIVPVATSLDTTGCSSGASTSFGTVMPGSSSVTSADCVVTFGSSNGSARLSMRQRDQVGSAMSALTTGTLDPTFGTAGIATVDLGSSEYAVVGMPAPDGKLVAIGYTSSGSLVARFTSSGALDPTFNASGSTPGTIIVAGGPTVMGGVVGPDGRITVAGSSSQVLRFTAAGVLDTSFDGDGIAITPEVAEGWSVILQPDGRVLVGGRGAGAVGFGVSRLMPDGSLDPSFAGDGGISTNVGVGGGTGYRMVRQGNGAVVMTGFANPGTGNLDFAAVRLTRAGVLDTTYDTDGIVTIPISTGSDLAVTAAIDPAGRVVMAGMSGNDVALTRLLPSGALDTSFSGDGMDVVSIDAASDGAYGVIAMSDGSVAMTGFANGGTFVARWTPAGVLDASFGTGGVVLISTASGSDEGSGIAEVDGGLVVFGYGTDATPNVKLVKMAGRAIPDFAPGVADWSTGAQGAFGACLRAVDAPAATGAGTWSVEADGTCEASNAAAWGPVQAAASGGAASTVATEAAAVDGAARLRFGLRAGSALRSGDYRAALEFEVVAP